MDKEISIGKIEIKIGGKTIPLSLEQARELKDALSQLFPVPVATVTDRIYYPIQRMPWTPWQGPIWLSNMENGTLRFSAK